MKGKICYYAGRNKKICGYQYRNKTTSISFPISKYGSLEAAKQAAEKYRDAQPDYVYKRRDDKISCECGAELRRDSMRAHLDTICHNFYIDLQDYIAA